MNKIYAKNLNKHFGETIVFQGFVEKIRDLQYVQFLVLKDGTGKVQLTIEKNEETKALQEVVANLTLESTVKVTGKLLESPSVKLNGMEIIPEEIIVTSTSLPELPFDNKSKDNSLRETRLDYRFIDLRREENNLLFNCQTVLEQGFREYWTKNQYTEIHTPKIAAGAAESGAEVFKIDYFGKEACLSQSPQFYKQMAMASGFDKVFEMGPVFRAENSHTSYHATEIHMADAEIAWVDGVEDVMEEEENWIKYGIDKMWEAYGEEIEKAFKVQKVDTSITFPRITFAEAKQILKDKYHYMGEKEDDFERKEEMLLCKYAKEMYNCDFVFVTKFPFSARPFYHMVGEDGLTKSYDLLFRGIEITTGAQREHRHDILRKQIIEKGVDPESLAFYLDFFKYGCPPHGGFGVGVARIMMQLFHIDNIREATFIYRGPTRLNP
ncbi:MAG: aspartate--tRNA(Asn) ligase [Bacilli bacterium]|nr:aspartate--tRNA(Asn) ligase [Bacilli bacterium]